MIEHLSKKGEQILISDDDKDLLSINWYVGGNGYVQCASLPHEYMHRIVLQRKLKKQLQAGEITDHINGNKLDNRRENLRSASVSQNRMNSTKRRNSRSQYRGVYFDNTVGRRKKWRASIRIDGKQTTIGYFDSELEASIARDLEAKKYYGDFARLNHE